MAEPRNTENERKLIPGYEMETFFLFKLPDDKSHRHQISLGHSLSNANLIVPRKQVLRKLMIKIMLHRNMTISFLPKFEGRKGKVFPEINNYGIK